MRDPDLWARLQAHVFDSADSAAPYSVKLARAEGWSAAYTARVIEEYRRFLYLTQVSDTQVTPCQVVDAAWHMHLTFTRDYWGALCPEVIGKPVHHQPCAGEEEMPRYRDQFAATKALYRAEFGEDPPADIWACTPQRRALPQFWRSEAAAAGPATVAILALFAGIVAYAAYSNDNVGVVMWIALIAALVLTRLAWVRFQNVREDRKRPRYGESAPGLSGLDWFFYESPRAGFDINEGFGDIGGGGDGDGGGCGGCGGGD